MLVANSPPAVQPVSYATHHLDETALSAVPSIPVLLQRPWLEGVALGAQRGVTIYKAQPCVRQASATAYASLQARHVRLIDEHAAGAFVSPVVHVHGCLRATLQAWHVVLNAVYFSRKSEAVHEINSSNRKR